ncbi:hypothetical protein [Pyxidicoccus caerfyrddinensis]|uniref:hypothetical protein n=1 Tax=Pyxidicoccus caerfyrddinensis TaxID=2709663 RepID=UPI0013D9F8B8|nr:hypothetical protein [Pyxidicoccus caerfyrddinensis]
MIPASRARGARRQAVQLPPSSPPGQRSILPSHHGEHVHSIAVHDLECGKDDVFGEERHGAGSVGRAPPPNAQSKAEAYWQEGTRLELACAGRDWPSKEQHVEALLGLKPEPWMQSWMYETTTANLEKQLTTRSGKPETVNQLQSLIQKLMPKKD